MHETSEGIERLFKMLKTGEVQEPEQSQTMEEAQQFVENLIQTPSSQREQKEGEGSEEVMQDAPQGEAVIEPLAQEPAAEIEKEPSYEITKEQEKEIKEKTAAATAVEEEEVQEKAKHIDDPHGQGNEEVMQDAPIGEVVEKQTTVEPVTQTMEQSIPTEKKRPELPKEDESQAKAPEDEGEGAKAVKESARESEKETKVTYRHQVSSCINTILPNLPYSLNNYFAEHKKEAHYNA